MHYLSNSYNSLKMYAVSLLPIFKKTVAFSLREPEKIQSGLLSERTSPAKASGYARPSQMKERNHQNHVDDSFPNWSILRAAELIWKSKAGWQQNFSRIIILFGCA